MNGVFYITTNKAKKDKRSFWILIIIKNELSTIFRVHLGELGLQKKYHSKSID